MSQKARRDTLDLIAELSELEADVRATPVYLTATDGGQYVNPRLYWLALREFQVLAALRSRRRVALTTANVPPGRVQLRRVPPVSEPAQPGPDDGTEMPDSAA